MALSKEDVAGIAEYARIALTDEELDEMTAYMNDAVDLLEPIRTFNLDQVDPTFHPIGDLSNVMGGDEQTHRAVRSILIRRFPTPALHPIGISVFPLFWVMREAIDNDFSRHAFCP